MEVLQSLKYEGQDECNQHTDNENVAIDRAIKMLSTNPARAFDLDDRGDISVGKRADLVAIEPGIHKVTNVWVAGNAVGSYSTARV